MQDGRKQTIRTAAQEIPTIRTIKTIRIKMGIQAELSQAIRQAALQIKIQRQKR